MDGSKFRLFGAIPMEFLWEWDFVFGTFETFWTFVMFIFFWYFDSYKIYFI